MSAERNMIVAGFPGVGKSAASRQCPDWIDFESSGFHWLPNGEENPKWPGNYIKAILDYDRDNVGKVIMISTHDVVVKAIAKHRPIICVVPDEDLRNEYMIRYLQRGSPADFIRTMAANWYDFITSVSEPWAKGLCDYRNHGGDKGKLVNYTVIFLGSGTTRIAAYDLRREFIGTEISKEYFEKQEKRFAEYTSQTRMF